MQQSKKKVLSQLINPTTFLNLVIFGSDIRPSNKSFIHLYVSLHSFSYLSQSPQLNIDSNVYK